MFYFHGTRKPDFKKMSNLDYDKYWEHLCPNMRTKLREREVIFIDLIKKGSKVLDIACGMSPFLIKLKEKKNCEIAAYDVSKKAIEKQKEKGVRGEVNDLSSPDFEIKENFDYIVMSEIIEHLAVPEILINKMKGKTKYLLISLPNSGFYRFRLSLMFKGRFFAQWAYHPSEHLRFWTHIDFVDWLEAMGLNIVTAAASNGLTIGPLDFSNMWKNLFGYQIVYLCEYK